METCIYQSFPIPATKEDAPSSQHLEHLPRPRLVGSTEVHFILAIGLITTGATTFFVMYDCLHFRQHIPP